MKCVLLLDPLILPLDCLLFWKGLSKQQPAANMAFNMSDQIKDITGGRCSIRGRITALDDKPTTVATGKDGRITPLFHFSLTDTSATIQGTAWDRSEVHKLLSVGMVVVVRNVVAKPCRLGFSDYHDFAFNFSKMSVLEVQADDSTLPRKEQFRVQTDRALNDLLSDGDGSKRLRSTSGMPLTQNLEIDPPCCETPNEPFCSSTGARHATVCVQCGATVTKKMYCPKTGLRHED